MADLDTLRPLERRVVRMDREGMPRDEIARRFRRHPRSVDQIVELAYLPDRQAQARSGLSPLERRLMRWREEGADLDDLSDRFRRGLQNLEQVLTMADLKTEGRFG
jgi:DNA-binding CsgD family transcriptional regulator